MIKFNESNAFFDGKELISSLNDICLELKHYDIEYEILPALTDEIKLKMLGIHLKGGIKRTKFEITIKANEWIDVGGPNLLKAFDKNKDIVISVIQQIESYMETEGLKCEFEYEHSIFFTNDSSIRVSIVKKDKFEPEDLNPGHDRLYFSKEYKTNPCRKIKIIFTK